MWYLIYLSQDHTHYLIACVAVGSERWATMILGDCLRLHYTTSTDVTSGSLCDDVIRATYTRESENNPGY